ncbi:SLAM family member 5-like isoform X2 [Bufo bufo]|nr:SLAM family member 5-like isoform X2 [Bufo bufo]XP_040268152.1 SLAM family member 5-like isoform X2 [Bufo bufo]
MKKDLSGKINDIYNIESSSHRPGSKNVKADALSQSFCVFQPPDTPPETILLAIIIVASLSANLASDIKAAQHLAPEQTPKDKLFVPGHFCLRLLDVMSDTPCVVRSLSSVEGEEVLLKVDLADLSEVSWVTRPGNYHIARTYIGGKIYIRGNNYKGRLFGESDGSLRISNLSRDDQGLYRANQRGPESLQCLEYYLQVYKQVSEDDLQIFYSVSRHEGCSVNITCAVQRSDLTVTWISSEGDIIVNGNVISIHDPSRNATYTCTAGNPSNNRSISVNPWSQCDKGRRHTRNRADYTWNNIGRLILSGCILVLTCCFFTCHLKTERNI